MAAAARRPRIQYVPTHTTERTVMSDAASVSATFWARIESSSEEVTPILATESTSRLADDTGLMATEYERMSTSARRVAAHPRAAYALDDSARRSDAQILVQDSSITMGAVFQGSGSLQDRQREEDGLDGRRGLSDAGG